MSVIDILSSDPKALLGLLNVPGLTLLPNSSRQTDVNQFAISGFATDAAIATIQGRGLTVTVVTTQSDIDAHDAQVLKDLAANNP